MSRFVTTTTSTSQQSTITAPMTNRCCQFILSPCNWTVPTGVCCIRARVWGAGGPGYPIGSAGACLSWCCYWGGFGGGFAMKTFAVTPGSTICAVIQDPMPYCCNCINITCFGCYVCATSGFTCSSQSCITNCLTGCPGCGVGGDVNYIGGCPTFHNVSCNLFWNFQYFPGGAGAANVFGNGGNSIGWRGDNCSMETSLLGQPGGSIVTPLPCCTTPKSRAPIEYSGFPGTCRCIFPLDIPLDYVGAGVGATAASPNCLLCSINFDRTTSSDGNGTWCASTLYYAGAQGYCGTKAGSGGGGAGCFPAGWPGGGGHFCLGARGLIILEW